jgi:hypothetical protein
MFVMGVLALVGCSHYALAQIGPTIDPAQLDKCQRLGIPENECSESAILAKERPGLSFDWQSGGLVIVAVVAIVGVVIVAIMVKRPTAASKP